MPVHQSDPNRAPDSAYVPGKLAYLVPGNRCRLLDGRRTPGVIESIDDAAGFFRWRITAFEDEGRSWDVPLEKITRYQFERSSDRNEPERVRALREIADRLSEPLTIQPTSIAREAIAREIQQAEDVANRWFETESSFFASNRPLDLTVRDGPEELANDLQRYLKAQSEALLRIETKTAEAMVLNPNSGEWIKGMLIVMAESGLVAYSGTIIRTRDLFDEIGAKHLRRAYLVHRLGFVRAAFRRAGHSDVVVYRGMISESHWLEPARSIVSCTFSLRVARSFAGFDRSSRFKTSYLMKLTVPIERLWMTFCETEQLNGRYREAEALVLNDGIGPFRTASESI